MSIESRTMSTGIQSSSTMSSAMADAGRYHEWVWSSFESHLRGATALEVGSGHGRYARKLAGRLPELVVSDIDPAAVERLKGELSDLPNIRFLTMDGVDPDKLGGPVDNIVLVNVLEHIRDDGGTLDACRRALTPGGRVLIFAPAFPLLFSRMDEQAGHFRRYRKAGLVDLMEGRGFRVLSARYFNAVGFFGWLANKWVASDVDSASTNAQVRLYDRLTPIFRHVDRVAPLIGQSVVAVGERR